MLIQSKSVFKIIINIYYLNKRMIERRHDIETVNKSAVETVVVRLRLEQYEL
jgi:hypothetical protein